MATGPQHQADSVRLVFLPVELAALCAGTLVDERLLFAALGSIFGIACSPDLDHHEETVPAKAFYRFGRLPGFLWRIFWRPYRSRIPRHRHWISHLPVVSTIIRQIYLLLIPTVITGITYLLGYERPFNLLIQLFLHPAYFWFVIGVMFSDSVHILMDYYRWIFYPIFAVIGVYGLLLIVGT